MSDLGVDLTGGRPRTITARYDGRAAARDTLAREASFEAPPPQTWGGAPFWQLAADLARLGGRALDFHALARRAVDVPPFTPGVLAATPVERTTFAFDSGLPTVVRRRLGAIFGVPDPVAGVEAGLALLLEAVGRRDDRLKPSTVGREVAVLTPAENGHELTRFLISLDERSADKRNLIVAARSLQRVTDGAVEPGVAPDPASLLVTTAGESERLAHEIAAKHRLEDPMVLDEFAIAAGAVRFGGLRSTGGVKYLGNLARSVQSTLVAPAPLGALVTVRPPEGGDPVWFWRRLFSAGQEIGGSTPKPVLTSMRTGPAGPDPIFVAECRNPLFFDDKWIHRDDWAGAGLRWVDTLDKHAAEEMPDVAFGWKFALKPRADPGQILHFEWIVTRSRTASGR